MTAAVKTQPTGLVAGTRRDEVARLVDELCTVAGFAGVDERLILLTGAVEALAPRQRDASIGRALKQQLSGLLILLERGHPGLGPHPTPLQRNMLKEVASLCERVGREGAANNPYWRCIVFSIRAECLLVLNSGGDPTGLAKAAIAASEAAYALIPEPRDLAETRHMFNRSLLDGSDPTEYATTEAYVGDLMDEVAAH